MNEMDNDTLFQHTVTGESVITAADSRFKLTWSIWKNNVSIICYDDCDVIIWVNTRSSNTFKDSFCSFVQDGQWLIILLGYFIYIFHLFMFTQNVLIFIMWLCICVNRFILQQTLFLSQDELLILAIVTSLLAYVIFVNKIVNIIYLFAVHGNEVCARTVTVVFLVIAVVLVAYAFVLKFRIGTLFNLNYIYICCDKTLGLM